MIVVFLAFSKRRIVNDTFNYFGQDANEIDVSILLTEIHTAFPEKRNDEIESPSLRSLSFRKYPTRDDSNLINPQSEEHDLFLSTDTA